MGAECKHEWHYLAMQWRWCVACGALRAVGSTQTVTPGAEQLRHFLGPGHSWVLATDEYLAEKRAKRSEAAKKAARTRARLKKKQRR